MFRSVAHDRRRPSWGAGGGRKTTSLEQVFNLLALPRTRWSRRFALVSANDRDHVAGMESIGAGAEEIVAIRAEDRRAQGVGEAEESEARRGIAARLELPGLVRVDTASRTSTAISDFMLPALGGPGYSNLLVVMPNKLAFFGDGHLVRQMATAFPSSWSGGALPLRGFWGMVGNEQVRTSAIELLTELAKRQQGGSGESEVRTRTEGASIQAEGVDRAEGCPVDCPSMSRRGAIASLDNGLEDAAQPAH